MQLFSLNFASNHCASPGSDIGTLEYALFTKSQSTAKARLECVLKNNQLENLVRQKITLQSWILRDKTALGEHEGIDPRKEFFLGLLHQLAR